MEKPRLLYFSNAFIASHGGRLHSEAFLKESKKNSKIREITVYPTPINAKRSFENSNSEGLRSKLKKLSLFQVAFFYRRNLNSYKEIEKVIIERKPDVIHIRLDSNFLIIDKLKKRFKDLIVSTEVNASPFDENFKNILFSDHFKKMERKSLQKADANFFVSSFLRSSIMEQYDDSRDFVVQNGVDLNLFSSENQTVANSENLTFGYVGTIDYHKKLKNLVDAFGVVQSKKPKTNLVIVGDGPMFLDLEAYIKSKNLEEFVQLTGWIDHNNIIDYLLKFDVAIHHSANKYMSPLKIFEYMAVGLPVIGPDIPSVREVFDENEDIILVEDSVKDLTQKMLFYIQNPVERSKYAEKGQQKIRSQYGWDSNVDTILTQLQKIYNENN